jgi:hypothetical protein
VESLRAAGADDSRARLALGRAQASQRRLLRDNSWLRRRPERERAYGEGGRVVDVRPLRRSRNGAGPIGEGRAAAAAAAHKDEIGPSSAIRRYAAASRRLGVTDHGASDMGNLLGDMSEHAGARAKERGISEADIVDALSRPSSIGEEKFDDKGRPSVRYTSSSGVVVAFNPDTGKITSVFRSRKSSGGRHGKHKG